MSFHLYQADTRGEPVPADGDRAPSLDDLSPAVVSALNRQVSLSVMGEPATQAVAKLGEAGDVAVTVDPQAVRNNVSLSVDNKPLWQALEDVATQSGLRIEASGDGLKLAMLPAGPKEEQLAAGARLTDRAAGEPAQRARTAPSGRATGKAAATRPRAAKPDARANEQRRPAVWGPALSQLRAQNFLVLEQQAEQLASVDPRGGMAAAQTPQVSQALGAAGGARGVPEGAPAVTLGAPRLGRPAPQREVRRAQARPEMDLARLPGAAPAPPGAPAPTPAPAIRPAPAERPMLREQEHLAEGEILLVRSADGGQFAALQALSHEGGRLRYRLWNYRDAKWGEPVERIARATARGGPLSIPVLGGNLLWPADSRQRFHIRGLTLRRTGLREIGDLDPADPRWKR